MITLHDLTRAKATRRLFCECWSWITKTPELGPSGGGCVSSEGFLLYSDKRLVMYIFTGYMLGIGEKLGSYRLKKLVVQQLIKAT